LIGRSDIEDARRRIADWVRWTPIIPLSQCQKPLFSNDQVVLKLESLQVTGSFKARGAMNGLLGRAGEDYRTGLVTASGGNHGLAVARTASTAGVPARIFVPKGVSQAKIDKIKAWNAEVEIVGDVWDESNAAAMEEAARSGALYLHPFADPLIVAGQGTLGLEILQDIQDLEAIVVAIGGGGLISGVSLAIHSAKPSVRIIGVEPVGSPTLKTSLDAGACIALEEVTTRVPTMACKQTDPRIFDVVRQHVSEVVLVSDDEMEQAARWLWFELGVAADLSGAASIAALRRGVPGLGRARRVCALICGAGPEGTR
jgi:threonine dehydratase